MTPFPGGLLSFSCTFVSSKLHVRNLRVHFLPGDAVQMGADSGMRRIRLGIAVEETDGHSMNVPRLQGVHVIVCT